MKKAFICFGLLFLFLATSIQAQDPRDSIIMESKTVVPGAHPGSGTDTAAYVYVKLYITNKDSLTFVTWALIFRSISGGAYMTLARPRTWNGMVNRLTTTMTGQSVFNVGQPPRPPGAVYNSVSPDSALFAVGFDPLRRETIEPPNAARKALVEMKFDTVFNTVGTMEIDTGRVVSSSTFTNTVPQDLKVNFLKSTITVGLKGDLNLDGEVRPADVVLELQCVYLGDIPPAGFAACDVNCDGEVSPADVAVFLNYKFITLMWPC